MSSYLVIVIITFHSFILLVFIAAHYETYEVVIHVYLFFIVQ